MYIGKGKRVGITFFCIKAYWDSLYCSNIIDRTALVKIGQRDLAVILVHSYRSDRCRDFLNERQSLLLIAFIRPVNKILQG